MSECPVDEDCNFGHPRIVWYTCTAKPVEVTVSEKTKRDKKLENGNRRKSLESYVNLSKKANP